MSTETERPAEHIIWKGCRSHWRFLGYWLSGVLLSAGVLAGIVVFHAEVSAWAPWIYALPAVPLLLIAILVTWKRRQRRYQVTNRRVVVVEGHFAPDSTEMRVEDIQGMQVNRRGLAGFLGVGDVEFSSAASDTAAVVFTDVPSAERVREIVRGLQS